MKNKKQFFRGLAVSAVAFLLILLNGIPFSAAQNSASSQPTEQDALLGAVLSMQGSAGKPTTQKPSLPAADHTTPFTWGSQQTLHGIYSSLDLYFTLPNYWDTRYACVQIQYGVSQLIQGAPCSLTFSINNQPFYSCEVAYNGQDTQTLYVLIPKQLLKTDVNDSTNYLQVAGYVRRYDAQGCLDDLSNANWITFSEDSGVTVGYNAKPSDNQLSYYPYPFVSSLDPTGAGTAVGIADTAQDTETAAAMELFSSLSNRLSGDSGIALASWADVQKGNYKNRILVSLASDLPPDLQTYVEPYRSRLSGQAMVLSVTDSAGNPLLLLVSQDKDCLMEGAQMLSDSGRVSQERGSVAFVQKGSAKPITDAKQTSGLDADRYTLQGMTGGGLSFIGPFHQVKSIIPPVPGGYTLSSAAKFTLKFRYSKNLDFTRSMLTVYWKDVPIGSKKLSAANADGDELTFLMPPDVVGSSAGDVRFAFDLEIQDMECTPRQDQMPWAYITPDSSLYLPEGENSSLLFDNRPAPFQKDGNFNNVLLVLPDHPTQSIMTLMGRAVAVYGAGAGAYGNLKVLHGSEFSEKDADYNIIAAGTPADNPFLAKINSSLYFHYDSQGKKLQSNDRLILSSNYAGSVGTLQLFPSPYSKSRAVLALTGPDDNTAQMISNLLGNEKQRWNLKDNCVLLDSDGKVRTFLYQQASQENKPGVVQSVVENKSSLLFALAGTSVMLALFLAVLLIFLRMRNSHRSKH